MQAAETAAANDSSDDDAVDAPRNTFERIDGSDDQPVATQERRAPSLNRRQKVEEDSD